MPSKRDANGSTRKRAASPVKRGASPVKLAPPTPARKIASPRKPRARKATTSPPNARAAKAASAALADALEDGSPSVAESVADSVADSLAESAADDSVDELGQTIVDAVAPETDLLESALDEEEGDQVAEDPLPENTVRVSVTTDVQEDGDEETKHTSVRIDMPADAPQLQLPNTTEGVLKEAEKIMDRAIALQEGESSTAIASSSKSHKRKASEMDPDGVEEIVQELLPADDAAADEDEDEPTERPTKRTRVMVAADEYRRERVQKRALLGLSASLAIGAMIPFVSSLF